MVAYFRSLNYDYVKKNQNRLKNYVNTIANELDKISTFFEESEGVELHCLPELLDVSLTIIYVGESYNAIKYNEKGKDLGFKLFYRPGHYEIVYA